ncbi:hypothetical protein ENU1_200930 [Entamoeba nuttalli P19]|uniref:Alpha-type protein kinase domain-containing protein n=1 Tax=Entamoeba nuttalli (strain P19) TaxID=1076696 RepID=K2HNA5_ENTNP|nr:hypothetical protein ENU1_200930 [Entamoeba nuttalli P19]EKE37335.1 hypothetical protein ENU1_200930 [Entamoeba nuttalli P19]|eukprot:XP_008860331.1 hypothetical protein ENU1_200930 [Entamoeba nuttalli P19]
MAQRKAEKMAINPFCILHLVHSGILSSLNSMNIFMICDISKGRKKEIQEFYQMYELFHYFLSSIPYCSSLKIFLISKSIKIIHSLNFSKFEKPDILPFFKEEDDDNSSSIIPLIDVLNILKKEKMNYGNRIVFIDSLFLPNESQISKELEIVKKRSITICFLQSDNNILNPYIKTKVPIELFKYYINEHCFIPFQFEQKIKGYSIELEFVHWNALLFPIKKDNNEMIIEYQKGKIVIDTSTTKIEVNKIAEGNENEIIDCFEGQKIIKIFIDEFNTRCECCGLKNKQIQFEKMYCFTPNKNNPFSRYILLTQCLNSKSIISHDIIQAFIHFVFIQSEETIFIDEIYGTIHENIFIISSVVIHCNSTSKFYYWKRRHSTNTQPHKCNIYCKVFGIFKQKKITIAEPEN